MNNENRAGNFTSSEIHNLMTNDRSGKGFGAPAKSYIEEKNMERKLLRSLNAEINARPTQWGSLLEKRVLYELLGTDYQPLSTETILHPDIKYWGGSPDARRIDSDNPNDPGTIVELKCPMTLKSYCQFADCKTIEEVRENHKDGDKYFWQTTSNAILTNSKFAELIFYCPFKSELNDIRELTQTLDGDEQSKYSWIFWAHDEDLPFLNDNGWYKNLHIIRWEVSENDKELLTGRVLQAGNLLQERFIPKDILSSQAA